MNEKVWEYASPDPEYVNAIASRMKLSNITASVLVNRGITTVEKAREFLNPSSEDLFDPFLLKDMNKASERIISAVENNEVILVFGDYDVDGITSTAVLVDFLTGLGAKVSYFIPDRIEEGYGLSIQAIDKVRLKNPNLIITVDCGITAVKEIEYIKSFGIDVVVTDHHQCKEILPEAEAVVNPCRPDCEYPFKELSGVGVVFKLVEALSRKLAEKIEFAAIICKTDHVKYLDMVCLGTVADVVSLTSENRIIVKLGLQVLQSTERPGLQAMMVIAGLKDRILNSFSIGYMIAPRINAAGRLGSASRAVELLLAKDYSMAVEAAEELAEENRKRQNTESEIFEQVNNEIKKSIDIDKEKVLVISGEGWHHGVIGIVASRVTDKYHRPCVLISIEGEIGKGSARSVEGFNLFEAMTDCSHLLAKYGGHELAAGLTIPKENINEFRERINKYAETHMEEECLDKHIYIDCLASPKELSISLVKELVKLEPFGSGNPAPVFAINEMTISEAKKVGEDKHLKLKLEKDGQYADAIGFHMGTYAESIDSEVLVDAAFCLEINTWNNVERLQFNLRDLRIAEELLHTQKYYINTDKNFRSWNIINYKDSNDKDINSAELLSKASYEPDPYKAIIEGKVEAVLINTVSGLKAFFAMVKKNPQALKNAYKICYTVFNGKKNGKVPVIINPDLSECDLSGYKSVLMLNYFTDFPGFGALIKNAGLDKLQIADMEQDVKGNNRKVDDLIPERNDLAAIFRYFQKSKADRLSDGDLQEVSRAISRQFNIQMNYFKLKRCMEIFEELKLMKLSSIENKYYQVNVFSGTGEKVPLENSELYRQLQDWKKRI